jgi:hypothetical protein
MNAQISGFYYLTSDGTSWLPLGAISWNQNILACFFLGGNFARLQITEKNCPSLRGILQAISTHLTKTIFLLFLNGTKNLC